MEAGTAFYVKQGTVYLIKLVGDIRYTMGCALGDFLDELFARALVTGNPAGRTQPLRSRRPDRTGGDH